MTTGAAPVRTPGPALYAAMLLALVGPTFNMVLLPPALPLLAQFLGGGASGELLAQRVQSLPFLGLAAGGLSAGALIGRLGLRPCLTGAALVYAGAGLAGLLATSASVLLAGTFVIGFAAALLSSGLTTATGAVFADRARARMLGFQTALSDFAAIAGGIGAALLAGAGGWRAPFCVYLGFGAVMTMLIAGARLPVVAREAPRSNGLAVVARLAAGPYLAGGAMFFVLGTQSALLPFHLAAHGLVTPTSRSLVLTGTPTFAMLASLAYGVVRGRVADHRVIVAAMLFSAAGYAAIALWHGGLAPVMIGAMATGLGMGLTFPLVIRAVFRRTEPALHAYSIGLLNSIVFFSAFLSPLLLGPVLRVAGAETLFLLCAAGWLGAGYAASLRHSAPRSRPRPFPFHQKDLT